MPCGDMNRLINDFYLYILLDLSPSSKKKRSFIASSVKLLLAAIDQVSNVSWETIIMFIGSNPI